MADVFRSEVVNMHRFLEDWLKGKVPKGDGRPERLMEALSEDFVVIHPNGSRGRKADVIESFASAYGEKPVDYALQLENLETRIIGKGLCIVTYEEYHRGEPGRARISTGVLRQRPDSGGIEWLFLQETPLALS